MKESELEIEAKRYVLHKQRVMEQRGLAPYAVLDANFDMVKYELDIMFMRLIAEVWQHKASTEVQRARLDVPSSWWQMLKRDHFPKWFLKRWPVKTQLLTSAVTFTRHLNYPDANFRVPDYMGSPVVFDAVKFAPWEKDCND